MRIYCIAQGTLLMCCGDLNGKEIKKEGIFVYVSIVHACSVMSDSF